MALKWISADILTGVINCDLPSLESVDPFRRTLGQYETSTAALTISNPTDPQFRIDPNWPRGILEGASVLCAYSGDPGSEVIEWAGVVIAAQRVPGNSIPLTLVTADYLLSWRNTPAYAVTNRDQNLIGTDLVNDVETWTGINFNTSVVGAAGALRDRTYNDFDDKSTYSNLQDLMGVIGGPEWTVHWVWTHNPELITPVFYIGTRIGNAAVAGLQPSVTFEPSDMTDWSIAHDYTAGNGANVVTATSSGQGLARPQSTVTATDLMGRPKREFRYTPSTSIIDVPTLTAHATQAVSILQNGNQAVSFTVESGLPGRTLGVDWNIGDDIGFLIQGPTVPDGQLGVGRCIGYSVTDTTVTPTLANVTVS